MPLKILKLLKHECIDESNIRNLSDDYFVDGLSAVSAIPFHKYSALVHADFFMKVNVLSLEALSDGHSISCPDFFNVDSVFISPFGIALELSCDPLFVLKMAALLKEQNVSLVR